MKSIFHIAAEGRGDGERAKTVLTRMYHTQPFKVMNPFHYGKRTEVIQMTASAGILSGDSYDLMTSVDKGGDLLVTGQGYTKVFRTDEGSSEQHTVLRVGQGSTLRYLPKPLIPFTGSRFTATLRADVAEDGRLFCQDIVSCGRSGSGERFGMTRYRSRTEIFVGGRLAFLDNCLIDPSMIDYESFGFFDGFSHMGTLFMYAPGDGDDDVIARVRSLDFDGRLGATVLQRGILVRALANGGDPIETAFAAIVASFPA